MAQTENSQVSKYKKHRKQKPWDTDDIDHWKIEQIKPQEMQPLLEQSSFSILFPQYREKYIQQCQGIVKKKFMDFGIKFELNLLQGSMIVRTTKKTWDPYSIIKARDAIKLISRSVPFQQALRVMEDGVFSQIIKIRSYVRNKERFLKRRQRLIGPNGDTLKALELLTQCYILVQGSTVCVVGTFKNVKVLKRVIADTMQNIHPIYHIKQLMVKRELLKDDKVKNQNWDRFLPKFKQVKINKKKKTKKFKNQYNPFPPEQQPRIEDIKMETGEYFLSQKQLDQRKMDLKKKKQEKKKREKQHQEDQEIELQNEQVQLQKEKKKEKEAQKQDFKRSQPTIDELKQKFLSKAIKKVKF